MSRSKHQFRPSMLEVFEDRIVPTLTPIPGIPFVPNPGTFPSSPNFTSTGFVVESGTNIIDNTVTNTSPDHSARYATFAIYRAPGGGNGNVTPTSGASENLSSQKLIAQFTSPMLIPFGQSYTFHVDVTNLDLTGPGTNGNHLTGDDDFQCDDFDAGCDPDGYAPDKPFEDALSNRIFAGELFQFDGSSPASKH